MKTNMTEDNGGDNSTYSHVKAQNKTAKAEMKHWKTGNSHTFAIHRSECTETSHDACQKDEDGDDQHSATSDLLIDFGPASDI